MSVEAKSQIKRIIAQIITVLGTIAAIISIYVFFFQDNEVRLQYEIITNTNVLDIKAELTRLDITYNGKSLKEKNEHLRIINLRIINRGNKNILKDYFDDNDLVGFYISNGKLIEKPEVIETSSQYLKNNLQIRIDAFGKVRFSKIILESNEYFLLKLLVLHKSNQLPDISAIGKIAGMKQIQVINLLEPKDQKPFFIQVFSGPFLIQIVRAILYFLIVIVIISGITFIIFKINRLIQKYKRKKIVSEFIKLGKNKYNKLDDLIFKYYINKGHRMLNYIYDLIKNEDGLNRKYRESIESSKKKQIEESKDKIDINFDDIIYISELNLPDTIKKMRDDGIIIMEGNKFKINKPMKRTIDSFFLFLKDKKM